MHLPCTVETKFDLLHGHLTLGVDHRVSVKATKLVWLRPLADHYGAGKKCELGRHPAVECAVGLVVLQPRDPVFFAASYPCSSNIREILVERYMNPIVGGGAVRHSHNFPIKDDTFSTTSIVDMAMAGTSEQFFGFVLAPPSGRPPSRRCLTLLCGRQ